MPFSNTDSIPTVLYFAGLVRPKRILDAGVGLGSYGLLFRALFDIAGERLEREKWQVRIDGLEIFEAYRNGVWDYAYDSIRIGDVRAVSLAPDSYDLVLIADVLEHLEETEARLCVERLLQAAPTVIATTPVAHIPQGAWGGNPHETHRSVLEPRRFPHFVCEKITGITRCFVCCRDRTLARSLRREAGNAPVSRPELAPYVLYRLRRKWRSLFAAQP